MAGTETERPRVGVSSCLLGEEVRFNGGHKRYRFLTDELGAVRGLGAILPGGRDRAGHPAGGDPAGRRGRLVNRERDRGPHARPWPALPLPRGPGRLRVQGQVAELRHPRPSRGTGPDGQAAEHDRGRGPVRRAGLARFPLLAVEDEGRLNDPGLREAFVERMFAAARLRRFAGRGVGAGGTWWPSTPGTSCRCWRTIPARYRSAGRVVAAAGTAPRAQAAAAYRDAVPGRDGDPAATPGRNANALQHAYSRIGRSSPARRDDLVARIEAYRRGEVPLSVPVALLAHYAAAGAALAGRADIPGAVPGPAAAAAHRLAGP